MRQAIVIGIAVSLCMIFDSACGQVTNSDLHVEVSQLLNDYYYHRQTNSLDMFAAFYAAHPSAGIQKDRINYYTEFMHYYARLLSKVGKNDDAIRILDEILGKPPPHQSRYSLLLTKALILRGMARDASGAERERLWRAAKNVSLEAEQIRPVNAAAAVPAPKVAEPDR
jgi:hypothetical protein